MSWIASLLDALGFLTGAPMAYLAVAAAVFLILARDWRLIFVSIVAFYLATSVLLGEYFEAHLAFSKFVVGLFVALIYYVTVQQLRGWVAPRPPAFLRVWPLGIILVAAVLAVVWFAAQQLTVGANSYLNFALLSLFSLGLLRFLTTSAPLQLGLGLLILLSGLELNFLAQASTRLNLGLFLMANLIIMVVVAYLAQAQRALQTADHPSP